MAAFNLVRASPLRHLCCGAPGSGFCSISFRFAGDLRAHINNHCSSDSFFWPFVASGPLAVTPFARSPSVTSDEQAALVECACNFTGGHPYTVSANHNSFPYHDSLDGSLALPEKSAIRAARFDK